MNDMGRSGHLESLKFSPWQLRGLWLMLRKSRSARGYHFDRRGKEHGKERGKRAAKAVAKAARQRLMCRDAG
jgi:hypothetical protein